MPILSIDVESEPPNRWIPIIVTLIIIALIAYTLAIPVNAGCIGAYNVTVTDKYVSSCGVCSCIKCTDRHHHQTTFLNYCPMCGHYGTLAYEEGIGWTSEEGLWYCTNCDADYCLVHGTEHSYHPKAYLTPYKPTITEIYGNKLTNGEIIYG